MSTDFPVSITDYTKVTGGVTEGTSSKVGVDVGGRTMSEFINDYQDDIEALMTKVGIDSSAVQASHDFKLSGVTGADKAVSLTGTEILTNKTLTSPVITNKTSTGADSGTETLTNKTIDPSANTIDGDKLDITFTPTNYTPDSSPPEADDADDLTAHLKGIDTQLAVSTITEDQLKILTVSLSAANIIAMNATPVEILAAPGAGKILIVDQVFFSFTFNSTQFTGGGDVRFQYDTTTDSIMNLTIDSGQIKAANDHLQHLIPLAVGALEPFTNKKVEITNATAAFATGNSTAKVFVRYRILTL